MIIILNWAFKLVMSFIFYSILTWLNAPEWLVIAVVAVVAVDSKFDFQTKFKR